MMIIIIKEIRYVDTIRINHKFMKVKIDILFFIRFINF